MKRTVESEPSRRERKENVDIERGSHKPDEERSRRQNRGRGAADQQQRTRKERGRS